MSYIPDDKPRTICHMNLYKSNDPSIRLGGYNKYKEEPTNKDIDLYKLQRLLQSKQSSDTTNKHIYYDTIMNTNKYSYSTLCQMLHLPIVDMPDKHIIISSNDTLKSDASTTEINDVLKKLTRNELPLFRKCIYNYNHMYSNKALQHDFIKFKEDISNILTILMKLSTIDKKTILVLL